MIATPLLAPSREALGGAAHDRIPTVPFSSLAASRT
jgi:hypothetical protein